MYDALEQLNTHTAPPPPKVGHAPNATLKTKKRNRRNSETNERDARRKVLIVKTAIASTEERPGESTCKELGGGSSKLGHPSAGGASI